MPRVHGNVVRGFGSGYIPEKTGYISASAREIGKLSAERRRELARLPFEEKIRIVVRLQEIAAVIRKSSKRKVWRLD